MTTPLRIPLAKPSFDDREIEAVRRVLVSGWVVQGPEVAAFEARIAEMQQARHCVAVSSGTAALHVCYLAMEVEPGDAVFIPSFAWPSAANMAVRVGARPVFVDVHQDTYNIDPDDLRVRVRQCVAGGWGRPRCVVAVHEFGLAADMGALQAAADESGLDVIEDGACALGATCHGEPVGTLGLVGTFSFHPRKAITTGEGGAIVTNDDDLAERCREWRSHGQADKNGVRDFVAAGLNYRMTDIQGAIGRVQIDRFTEILATRKRLAKCYLDALQEVDGVTAPPWDPEHTWQTLMVVLHRSLDRSRVMADLAARGIGVSSGAVAAHRACVHRQMCGAAPPALPISQHLHDCGLALPLHQFMSEADVEQVVAGLAEAVRAR